MRPPLFFQSLFKPKPARLAGAALYASAVAQARRPQFYAELSAPDTMEGRFELYTLHVILLIQRLKGQGAAAQDTSQAIFDAYVQSLDIALREMGVGDLSVGKKMKKLGRAFYGRARNHEAAKSDPEAMRALIARTVYEGVDGADPGPLVTYAQRAADHLAEQPIERLLAGDATWPEPLS